MSLYQLLFSSSERTRGDLVYDDGSVFTEEHGIIKNIRPGELVRPCGAYETTAAFASNYRNFTTVMPVWLESKMVIQRMDVLEALRIVSRQVPSLQFCLKKRRGSFWFKRMANLEIDFESSLQSETELLHQLLDTTFDLQNGPLWKVRMLTPCREQKGPTDKYSTVIVFAILHSINDGVTNMVITREFVSAMNQLTAGKVVTPTFSPVIPPIDKIARSLAPLSFLIKKSCSTILSRVIGNFNHQTSFSGRIPSPETRDAKTRVLWDGFSESETELVALMCKAEKVSINTFIITVSNFALMAVAQSRSGSSIGPKKIAVAQNVNIRRHFDSQYREIPGYHATLLQDEFPMSLTDSDRFWTLANENHTRINNSLKEEQEHLRTVPIYGLARFLFPLNNFLTRRGFRSKTVVHYVTSNMGNLKDFLPEPKEEDNIKIKYLVRACSLQLTGSLFMLNFHTLNGKLILSLDYYTNQMKDEIAREFFDLLFKFVRNIISHQPLNGGQDQTVC